MNAYRITGTSRPVGAIGIHETFDRIVFSASAREAYAANRDHLYAINREHVVTKKIEESLPTSDLLSVAMIGTEFREVDPGLSSLIRPCSTPYCPAAC